MSQELGVSNLCYDGLCLIGFGGPESVAEVGPFLSRIALGAKIPAARIAEVQKHYEALGGFSPINRQHQQMLTNLVSDLAALGISLPAQLGNRNSAPWLADALQNLYDQGCRRVLCVLTSPFPSYSGCRQYRENVDAAVQQLRSRQTVGSDFVVEVAPPYPDLPGLVAANAQILAAALQKYPDAPVIFTAHSLPESMADTSGPACPNTSHSCVGPGFTASDHRRGYVQCIEYLISQIAAQVNLESQQYCLAWQSRSGPTHIPWLKPDVVEVLHTLATVQRQAETVADAPKTAVLLLPIGFLTDHVEVLWDLDHEALQVAAQLGLDLQRLDTVGFRKEFRLSWAANIADLLCERLVPKGFCGKDCCVKR